MRSKWIESLRNNHKVGDLIYLSDEREHYQVVAVALDMIEVVSIKDVIQNLNDAIEMKQAEVELQRVIQGRLQERLAQLEIEYQAAQDRLLLAKHRLMF